MAAEAAAEPDLTEHLLCQVLYCELQSILQFASRWTVPLFPSTHLTNYAPTNQPTFHSQLKLVSGFCTKSVRGLAGPGRTPTMSGTVL